MRAERLFRLLVLALFSLAVVIPASAAATEETIASLLAEARLLADGRPCEQLTQDSLARVLCRGQIRIGVRTNYEGFGLRRSDAAGGAWTGYEIDVARAVAARLGVTLELVGATPATRIAMLVEQRVDVVIATMGHTVLRDEQIRFVRPHYYRSQTVIIGDRRIAVQDEQDLDGRTVCVPLGNADTARIAGGGARLLIFDNPQQMVDALRKDICTLVMHDDSFFSASFTDPAFRQRFEPKLVVSSLPWGMATAHDDRLARLLDLVSVAWHAERRFLALARPHSIETGFLQAQHQVWVSAACRDATGGARSECLDAPADSNLAPTAMAGPVEGFEHWLRDVLGLSVTFPMLKWQVARDLFLWGVLISLLLVAGSLVATFAFAVGFGVALSSSSLILRLATRTLTGVMQCSPLVLLLFLGYATVSTMLPYSTGLALLISICMIGLYNGSHAAQAIADAYGALRATQRAEEPSLRKALQVASVQMMSFLVNAAKSSSIASMIGVPELLNALTDITSFTSERVMTYSFLLVFYSLLVLVVVWATKSVQRRLQP